MHARTSLRSFMLCLGMIPILSSGQSSSPQTPINSSDLPLRTSSQNPDAVAVVVGISHYQNTDVPPIEYAIRDAEAVRRLLIQTLGYASSRVV
jgi:hypothetical protein